MSADSRQRRRGGFRKGVMKEAGRLQARDLGKEEREAREARKRRYLERRCWGDAE